jgi:putative membrane protein
LSGGGIYLWAKAAHVIAVLLFVGGALTTSVACKVLPDVREGAAKFAAGLRRWDQRVTTPALLATWALGLFLASSGHWFSQIWLGSKLAIVLLLSGLHGVQSGRLRRIAEGAELRPWRATPVIVLCIVAIAGLAVLKPA